MIALPAFIGAYYGRTHYAQIMGWLLPFTALFGAAGPVVAGAIYQATHTYLVAFITLIVFTAGGGVCALLARPPRAQAAAHLS